jgi:ribonuclease D
VSRFIVASNALLAALARENPGSLEGLGAVKGVGPERSRKYGEAILAALAS